MARVSRSVLAHGLQAFEQVLKQGWRQQRGRPPADVDAGYLEFGRQKIR
jgi:hypothetical protein